MTIMADLWAHVCSPILAAAQPLLTVDQARALAYAPLILVSSEPATVAVMGFAGEPVDCGSVPLPAGAGAVLARFFEQGIAKLDPDSITAVARALESGRAHLVASLRPDRAEATCFLVAHHDAAEPVRLFTLVAEPEHVH